MPSSPESAATVLARFPAEVLEAYQRFHAQGDADAVEAVVIAAVVDYHPSNPPCAGPPTEQTRLVEDMGYDSVSVAELVFFLEDLFDVSISNDELVRVRTIADLRACVARKLAAKSPAA